MRKILVLLITVISLGVIIYLAYSRFSNSNEPGVITNSIGMKFKLIPAGSFTMGSPDDEEDRFDDQGPLRTVEIEKPFFMGIYEVTQDDYEEVMDENPSKFSGGSLPVDNVSWGDAVTFCEKLTESDTEYSYRLPTEAEWEYACRAGTSTPFYWGDTWMDEYCWCLENAGNISHKVGRKKPNPWGLYDMSGNVWEFCSDFYTSRYPSDDQEDFQDLVDPKKKVVRGGSWGSWPMLCRSAHRDPHTLGGRYDNLGFRIVAVKK